MPKNSPDKTIRTENNALLVWQLSVALMQKDHCKLRHAIKLIY